jgi:hypothetical protein
MGNKNFGYEITRTDYKKCAADKCRYLDVILFKVTSVICNRTPQHMSRSVLKISPDVIL